jgi:hypothetical protein
MNLDDFRFKWTNKPTDFDGVYPNQCMDLMHFYAYQVLGITDKSVLAKPWAAKVFTEFSWPQYFTRIDNKADNYPQKGDLFFFSEALNYDPKVKHGYGHVCIVIDADVNSFSSFDANWPVGTLPHIQHHDYKYALGWLRPNTSDQDLLNKVMIVINSSNMANIKISKIREILRNS